MQSESREQMVLRTLFHLARTDIGDMGTGPTATVGTAKSDSIITSIGSQRSCIGYKLELSCLRDRWTPLRGATHCEDFFVHDSSEEKEEARVCGEKAHVAFVHVDHVSTYNRRLDLRRVLGALGYAQNQAAHWYLRETLLLPGDSVVVAGMAGREPVPHARAGYRGSLQNRPVLRHDEQFPLLISNSGLVETGADEAVIPQRL